MDVNRFSIPNPLPPPWMRHPHIQHASIGWRMGYGEDYMDSWSAWYNALSEDERGRYREMFPQPKSWLGFYAEEREGDGNGLYSGDEFRCKTVRYWNINGEMSYTRDRLIESDQKPGFVFFWKPEDNALNESCLGQWQPSPFACDTDRYSCAEQYMMAEKARLFGDEEMRSRIIASLSPKEMKALGRKVRDFDGAIWDRAKHSIVLQGNFLKFAQNPEMRAFLLATGNKVLVEASHLDTVWGIGLGAKNQGACDPAMWRGQNLLGFALMEVRDEIARVYRNFGLIDWDLVNSESNCD